MSLVSIGPVSTTLKDPSIDWSATPTSHGIQPMSMTGLLNWSEAHQLRELVANPARQETKGGVTGVLEYVEFSSARLSPFTGWYLLESFTLGSVVPQWTIQTSGYQPVPFSLEAHFLGAAEVVIDGGTPSTPLAGAIDGGTP